MNTTIEDNQTIAVNIQCYDCDSPVLLNVWPHEDAGHWECTNSECGMNDYCEHVFSSLDEADKTYVYMCDDCGQETERTYDDLDGYDWSDYQRELAA
jgi:hypothetical protein